MNSIDQVPDKIKKLYEIVKELQSLFPGRHFTPDGHLIGSIGEVLATYYYGLELLPASAATHDAKTPDRKFVQIKATQRNLVGIRAEPEYLLVLRINEDGSSEEVYSGPGRLAWEAAGKKQSNGQPGIRYNKLLRLMDQVSGSDKILRLTESRTT